MIDFYNYNLENEIAKIKNTDHIPSDIDYYSSRKILHELYEIPKNIDIEAYVFHGINITDYEVKDYALDVACPTIATRKAQVEHLLKKGKKPDDVFCSGALFPQYRELHNITQAENAKGTIVFPFHSCLQIDTVVDWQLYIDELKKLPDEYKPLNICMYYLDILKGRHEIFIENGFSVYTAGHCNDEDFVDNFYEIARHHKYATMNHFGGSNLLYLTEFGINVFIYGEKSFCKRKATENFYETQLESIEQFSEIQKFTETFFKKHYPVFPKTQMTDEAKNEVLIKLGMDYQTPKNIARKILIKHSHKIKRKKTMKKLAKFFFNKEKNENRRKITIFGFIKFNYKRPKTQSQIANELKNGWIEHESHYYNQFKDSEMVNNLNENSICIDCGANVGTVTELFASKGATVYSFEPHPMCFKELEEKFSDNNKIHLYNQGVLDKSSTLKLYKFKYHNEDELFFSQGSSLYSSNEEIDSSSYDEVEVIDLCEFIKNLDCNIDILKMDIEGAEFCILEKMIEENLHTRIKQILVETHDNEIEEIKEIAQRVRNTIQKKNITNIDLNWV